MDPIEWDGQKVLYFCLGINVTQMTQAITNYCLELQPYPSLHTQFKAALCAAIICIHKSQKCIQSVKKI